LQKYGNINAFMTPEHRARVLFEDSSSRRDAHNLDDLRERWRLSREAVGNIPMPNTAPTPPSSRDTEVDFFTFDFTSPPSIDVAREWDTLLQNRYRAIEVTLSAAKTPDNGAWRMRKRDYLNVRAALVAEQHYIHACRNGVKAYIREWSKNDIQQLLEQAEEYDDIPTILLSQCYLIVKRLLNNGAEISEEDNAIIHAIQDYLKSKMMEFKKQHPD
jgi:hypothetical protein